MFAIPNTVGLVFFSVHNILIILLVNHISAASTFFSSIFNFHTHKEIRTTHTFSQSSVLSKVALCLLF